MSGRLSFEEVEGWQRAKKPFILVDVRDAEEVLAGSLPAARHIPLEELARYAPVILPDKSMPIVCYCHSGRRSAAAQRWLIEAGYAEVWNLEEGYQGIATPSVLE